MGNELKPIDAMRDTIDKMGVEFCKTLPDHIPVEKFQRVVMNQIAANPSFLQKDRASLLSACMKAAGDGLLLDGREAALVSFGNEVSYMRMVAGILKLIRNSGEVSTISTGVVHENDEFRHFTDDDGEHFHHEANHKTDRGQPYAAFAMVRTKDGGVYIEVMNRDEIEKVRSVSKSKDSGPWKQWPGEMWRKTVVRRLSKRLPMSTDVIGTIAMDDDDLEVQAPVATVTPLRPTRFNRDEAPAADSDAVVIEQEMQQEASGARADDTF